MEGSYTYGIINLKQAFSEWLDKVRKLTSNKLLSAYLQNYNIDLPIHQGEKSSVKLIMKKRA